MGEGFGVLQGSGVLHVLVILNERRVCSCMRVPNRSLARLSEKNLAAVQTEIAREKAASLGRVATKLEEAIGALEAFDAQPGTADPEARPKLVRAAAQALWYYVVQREACGLRDVGIVLREFRVPREVYERMGMAPRRG